MSKESWTATQGEVWGMEEKYSQVAGGSIVD
jgi:hypothetical protein